MNKKRDRIIDAIRISLRDQKVIFEPDNADPDALMFGTGEVASYRRLADDLWKAVYRSVDDFIDTIVRNSPDRKWIAVQYSPKMGWSVAHHPLPWLPGGEVAVSPHTPEDQFDEAAKVLFDDTMAGRFVGMDTRPIWNDVDEDEKRTWRATAAAIVKAHISREMPAEQPVVFTRWNHAVSAEVDHLMHVIDRDRYVVAHCVAAIKEAIAGRTWLLEGRGPYEWDDDDYRKEFGDALRSIREAAEPLAVVAWDKSDCSRIEERVNAAKLAAHKLLAKKHGPREMIPADLFGDPRDLEIARLTDLLAATPPPPDTAAADIAFVEQFGDLWLDGSVSAKTVLLAYLLERKA